MEFVGEQLRKARLRKKLSLRQLSKELHISISILESIENNNNLENIGKVYIIGYIRTIANFFQLDSNQIIIHYKEQNLLLSKKEKIEIPKPISSFNFFLSYKLVSLVSICSLSFAFYFMFLYENNYFQNYALTPDISEDLQSKIEQIELENALSKIKNEKKNQLNNENSQIYITDSSDLPKIDTLNLSNSFTQ